ncbi:MAG: ribosome recycling factor [Clostridia bacterium]|nr:ribosome recycling factor [Clostridia bacterium]
MSYNIDEVDLIFDEFDERITKTINNFKSEMLGIRAVRANPHILDKILVDYYGTPTPINNMANVSVPEARLLVISPWDKSQLKPIEKAILAGNIGLTPNNDGQVIRLIFPELTEDRRRSTVKEAKALVEECKIVMRNARRDAIDELKKMQKASTITEDDLKNYTTEIDKKLSGQTDEVDKIFKDKEQEILSI